MPVRIREFVLLSFHNKLLKFYFSVINDNYEQLDAIATCFPWCTNATSRFSILPKNMQCKFENFLLFLHIPISVLIRRLSS